MPTYCFKTTDGLVVDRTFPMGHAPGSVKLPNDQIAVRDFQSEHVSGTVIEGTGGPAAKPLRKGWPMAPCVASGVHASQAQELRDHLTDRGVPTEVTSEGDPIYTSASHRKRALKARGFHDRAGFD